MVCTTSILTDKHCPIYSIILQFHFSLMKTKLTLLITEIKIRITLGENSARETFLEANFLHGENYGRQKFRAAKFQHGKLSALRNFHSAKLPVEELSAAKLAAANFLAEKLPRTTMNVV